MIRFGDIKISEKAGGDITWELRKLVSLYSGLLMIGLAFWVDIRSRHKADYAFWLYIFGVITFWGGLSSQSSDDELSKFIYFCINLLMIGVGALLIRRVFVVFGALGSCGYLGYLAFDVFSDSWLFPMTLTSDWLWCCISRNSLAKVWASNHSKVTITSSCSIEGAIGGQKVNPRRNH